MNKIESHNKSEAINEFIRQKKSEANKIIKEAINELYPEGMPKDIHFNGVVEFTLLCIEKILKEIK
jgi:hypothetical protein